MNGSLPKTDLQQLRQDVLTKGPEAALPSRLSDYWLELISRDLECLDGVDAENDSTESHSMAGPLALILHILLGKSGGTQLTVPEEDMYRYFQDYRIEIGLEEVSRRTDIKMSPATIDTIFTNRDVDITDTGNI
jgi:hypothetical protein